MVDIEEVAARLDNDEPLNLKYRARVNGSTELVIRVDRLLDVAEDQGIFYVDHDGQPIWVRQEEAIEVTSDK
ncbi:MAG: hypothetical protein HYX78_10130 [Armatimonadetes bacterium]|nr:hypothetical protein [Armatimonadota bacterium]